MGQKVLIVTLMCLVATGVAAKGHADAGDISWTNWSSVNSSTKTAQGSILFSDGTTVGVSYTGDIIGSWVDWNEPRYATTYIQSGVVNNAPPNQYVGINLGGGTTGIVDTITFSEPVLNPVFAIMSLGFANVNAMPGSQYSTVGTYTFTDAEPFTIVNQGPGYWGQDVYQLTQSGNELIGYEGNGLIQFSGTFSSITWTSSTGYPFDTSILTLGAPAAGSPVPAPAAFLLLGPGLAGLVALRRRLGT